MGKRGRRTEEALAVLAALRRVRPRTRDQLSAYVSAYLGLTVPARRVCKGHDAPLDYLTYAVLGEGALGSEGSQGPGTGEAVGRGGAAGGDCLVWANRGGGKTQLGAAATLLEGVFLGGCQVRILGGSEEQSQRMYGYLRAALGRGYAGVLAGEATKRGCVFSNGSAAQVLTQSDRSVRGEHVQRLRCDEVELFDRDVWQAAQFVTHSREGIGARLEVFSTMHRPYGLMSELVGSASQRGLRVFRWCLWEVIERCVGRTCSQCGLWEDCRGRAQEAGGYYRIEDALAVKRRSSRSRWQAEMLCERPNREEVVFAEFDPAVHVRSAGYRTEWPLYRALDFGYSNPMVCLFLQVSPDGSVWVIDEHVKSRATLSEQARLIKERTPGRVEATYCDPAGRQRNEITGTGAVTELAALGIPVRCRSSRVSEGVELVRDFLAPGDGRVRLFVGSHCEHLIRAFEGLSYKRHKSGQLTETPEKDGVHDHLIDALRYFFVNRFGRRYEVKELRY